MERDYFKEYVDENRIKGKRNFYKSARAAEVASTIYDGSHFYYNKKTNETDCWFIGKMLRFGV